MIIQRTGVIKFLRYLGIFCAITMGFFSIVATSEDDAADLVSIPVDADYDLSAGEVTVDKTNEIAAAETLKDGKNCTADLSVNGLLATHPNAEDIEKVNIETISYREEGIRVRYKDATTDPALENFTCTVSFAETSAPLDDAARAAYNEVLPPIDVTLQQATYSDWIVVTPTAETIAALNYFLDYRDATFQVCVTCTVDVDVVTDWSVTVEVEIPVNLKGDI